MTRPALVLACLLVQTGCLGSTEPPQVAELELSGTVTVNGEPLSDAAVVIRSIEICDASFFSGACVWGFTRTDDAGRYLMRLRVEGTEDLEGSPCRSGWVTVMHPSATTLPTGIKPTWTKNYVGCGPHHVDYDFRSGG